MSGRNTQQSNDPQDPREGSETDPDTGGMHDDVEVEDIDEGTPIDDGTSLEGVTSKETEASGAE